MQSGVFNLTGGDFGVARDVELTEGQFTVQYEDSSIEKPSNRRLVSITQGVGNKVNLSNSANKVVINPYNKVA